MHKKILTGMLILCMFIPSLMNAQGEIDEQETVYYNDETTWSGILGTSGWGLDYRKARRVNATLKNLWSIDMVSLNHSKETSEQSRYVSGFVFTYGKTNVITNLRFSIGQTREIYRKVDVGGVSLRWFYEFGPSVIWQKPVYYKYYNTQNQNEYYDKFYSEYQRPYDFIVAKGSFGKGFNESTFVFGGHINTGLSFDYSARANYIMALEVGLITDVYSQRLDMLAVAENPFYFVQVYASLRFGKIVDRMKVRLKKTRKEMEKKQKFE
ncbi:MAG: hypothetical protein RIS47_361 [Bacteroidota bacterium]|jgi:hypothetical protein